MFTFFTSFFYTPPLICDLPLTWPVFHNTAVFVLGPYYTYERKHAAFGLLHLANFIKMMLFGSMHLSAKDKISFFFVVE
jgi:hypothetical protein